MPLEILKVCGLTRPDDAVYAVDHGATAVGMIFYPPSPRSASFEQAAEICDAVGERALKVGVFVNEAAERIASTVERVGLDVVQLHGEESPADCALLGGLRRWKALRVGPDFAPESFGDYACEAFLLDTARAGAYGGTGETFPWEIARRAAPNGRIILAGGLDGSNVAEAVRAARPWGVDSSSRLESRPGVKDPEKVRRYLEAARSA